MSHFKITIIIVGILVAAITVFLVYKINVPTVTFHSSDYRWSESEDLFKGGEFDAVIWNFADYRASCNPDAKLRRSTPRNFREVLAWPNYVIDRKWRVPYEETTTLVKDHSELDCHRRFREARSKEEQERIVKVEEQRVLKELSEDKKAGLFER